MSIVDICGNTFTVGADGVFRGVLARPRRCGCGRMVYFVINRDGKTRCIECDGQHVRAEALCCQSA